MATYECPKCKRTTGMSEIGANFSCSWKDCKLTLSSEDYLPIAAAICKKPLDLKVSQPMSEYKLPEEVVNNILKVVYSIKQVREQKLEELTRRQLSLVDLRELNKDGGLKLLLNF